MIDDMTSTENVIPLGRFDRTQQYRMQRIVDRFAQAQMRAHAGEYEKFREAYPEFSNRKLFDEGLLAILRLKGAYHVAQRHNPRAQSAAYNTQLAQDAIGDFLAAVTEHKFRNVATMAAEMQCSLVDFYEGGRTYDPFRTMLAQALCSVRGPAITMAKELDAINYARKRPEMEKHRLAAEQRADERFPAWREIKREAAYKRAYAP